MRARQQGITAIGFIIVAAFVGVFAFAALKIAPLYLEQMKVVRILEDVKKELDGEKPSITMIRSSIGKRLDIEMVSTITANDFVVKKNNAGYLVQLIHERREPFFGNLYFLVVYDKQVEITR